MTLINYVVSTSKNRYILLLFDNLFLNLIPYRFMVLIKRAGLITGIGGRDFNSPCQGKKYDISEM